MGWARGPPLCPAGHRPLKGGDQQLKARRFFFGPEEWRKRRRHPISPLEGEMAGRPERGAQAPPFARSAA
ncbi:hypothetical protein EOA31_18385 [Mesorhizobium sp. M4B.F.Ca.ET.049.02.1.2]|nr:hypothetical protein EOA31_18385 [Mesorhizobium sp. M4B.F.Ca.ET.049.02.1.2]